MNKSEDVVSIFEKREWQAEPPQQALFDYRKVATTAFVAPKRASKMEQAGVFTAEETAKIYNKCMKTIYRWLGAGILTGEKIGNEWEVTDPRVQRRADRRAAARALAMLDPLKKTGTD